VTFEATLVTRGRGHVVALPFNVGVELGAVRVPVTVTVNGHMFRTTAMRYRGTDYIGLNREVREAAGVTAGNTVTVTLERDEEPRELDVPPELAEALARDAPVRAAFEELSYTHRKEYARWIAEAKREETRERRLANAVEMLRAGVPTPG
jgi:hypothetical protein